MEKPSKENLTNDIENRLDDFFDESEEAGVSEAQSLAIEKLKSIVLSIDWEITDECLTDLILETEALLPYCQNKRFIHTLLRMLKAVGIYIRKRKAQAHQDAIKRIMSVFSSIEKLTETPDMEEDAQKQIVAKEISEFKRLKEQVEMQRGGTATPANPTGPDLQEYIESETFEKAMNAIEGRLNAQVDDLKEQLEKLQKKLDRIRSS